MGKRSRRRYRHDGEGWASVRPGRVDAVCIDAEATIVTAVGALRAGDVVAAERAVAALASAWEDPRLGVARVLATRLQAAVRCAFANGWQPLDLPRVIGRRSTAVHALLVVDVITEDARRYRADPRGDQRWLRQLDALGSVVGWDGRAPFLDQWAAREGLDRMATARCAVELVALVWYLPRLPIHLPPPDEWARIGSGPVARASGVDPRVLDRVNALLAKAESTTFSEEADAFTAKAQQLMARHAIDRAMVGAAGARAAGEQPGARRLGVDDPYSSAKMSLLTQVATASRCRTVWSKELGFGTVFGFEDDLDTVELLYTSLLVQATTAMVAAGTGSAGTGSVGTASAGAAGYGAVRAGSAGNGAMGAPSAVSWGRPGAHKRSRSFRQSFLVGFAVRIGERLREAARATVDEAVVDHGDRLLPVLAARDRAVEDARDEAFPQTTARGSRISDGAGWAAGRTAADLASLSRGPEVGAARSA